MSQVLQVIEVFEIWICYIFGFFWSPKETSTLGKQPTEYDGDDNKNQVYINITVNLYPLLNFKRRWYEP